VSAFVYTTISAVAGGGMLSVPFLFTIMATLSSSTTALATLLTQGERIATSRLVLASQSPRRKEIFDLMGLSGKYEVIVSGFPENLDKSLYCGEGGPARYAKDNACCKAREVIQRIEKEEKGASATIVVGSDTIVDLDGQILEKPGDAEEAKSMLRRLSGREHLVHSGVGIFVTAAGAECAAEPAVAFSETTRVRFGKLTEEDIAAYVQSGEPMDKAGSYGIQGLGGQFVDGIQGCYFNVMGFPMRRFSTELSTLLLSPES
jgi:septum formation protein